MATKTKAKSTKAKSTRTASRSARAAKSSARPAKAAPAVAEPATTSASKNGRNFAGPTPEIRRTAMLLKQVSDPTRLKVMLLLSENEHNVGGLCEELGGQSQPAVSHHLALLRHGQLIEPRRDGKNNIYRLTEKGRQLATAVGSLVD